MELRLLYNKMIKVKSLTDVITNSSTEVYSYVNESSLENLKKFINGILNATGSGFRCDDLFEIKYVLKDGSIDDYWNYYEEELSELYCKKAGIDINSFDIDTLTEKERENTVLEYSLSKTDGCGNPMPHSIGFVIKPSLFNDDIPELDLINKIFLSDEFYV